MAQVRLTLDSETLKGLFTREGKDQAFGELINSILNQVLNEQANAPEGAGDLHLSK